MSVFWPEGGQAEKMAKQLWQPTTTLAPIPAVLVSCGDLAHPNVLTVAWTGIVNTKPAMTYVSLQPTRYSYGLIAQSGEFVINLVPQNLVRAADFCGVRSGRDVDKFAACALTPQKMPHLSAPGICECPVQLECRVHQRIALGSHEMFLAKICGVLVEDSLMDASGKMHMERAHLAAYAHGAYYALGRQLGTFGFSVRKKCIQNSEKK